ncbi:hypothetical protein ACE6ED_12505 [Paenibacillus sp. CN-4]
MPKHEFNTRISILMNQQHAGSASGILMNQQHAGSASGIRLNQQPSR